MLIVMAYVLLGAPAAITGSGYGISGTIAAVVSPTPIPAPALQPTATQEAAQHANKTVFLIVMENTNWLAIEGSDSAPYITQALLPMAAYAEEYYNPPGLHPSEPNYLWLEAGANFGVNNDANPSANHQDTTMHLVTLLDQAGVSWKSYQEDISGTDVP